MRIRYKPWARAELEACPFYIDDPTQYKGKWQEVFEKKTTDSYRTWMWQRKLYCRTCK